MRNIIKIKFFTILFFCVVSVFATDAFAVTCSIDDCPASVANEIAAAWATEGYWFQGDIIWQLENTDLGLWAPLLYICSALGFLIMMAMGQPPRTYLWFALGPAIFHWFLFTKEPVEGVAWAVQPGPDGYAKNLDLQEEVWRIAYTGLLNSNYAMRNGITPHVENGPQGKVEVAMFFLWADKVISSSVLGLSAMTGFNVRREGDDHIHEVDGATADDRDETWAILSNAKWPMLENITNAAIFNEDLREAFVSFMSSECGDVITKNINTEVYLQAMNRKGEIPEDVQIFEDLDKLGVDLAKEVIPIPQAVKDLVAHKAEEGKFRNFNEHTKKIPKTNEWRNIDCGAYLYLIVQGMRFEAGHAYNQFIQEAPGTEISEEDIIRNFLYGWRIEDTGGLDGDEPKQFIQDLILLHIMRNEFVLTPTEASPRWSAQERSINYSETYHRKVGSKSKYGELYTWAKMMPYMQGLLLYIIAAAYPFCCILLVLPGWHKIMFSWLGFFAWAKSWDFGFAMVMTVERSLWAMIGNNQEAHELFQRVHNLRDIGTIEVTCPGGKDPATNFCELPAVVDGGPQSFEEALKVFQEALLLSGSLDLELKNTYYIYLMSALYFAVPAVTGQILLGARSGASSMVNTMVGQTAQEGGRKSGEGFSSDMAQKMQTAQAVTGRTAYGKSIRSSKGSGSDFLSKAYGAELDAAKQNNIASVADANRKHLEAMSGINQSNAQSAGDAVGLARQGFDYMTRRGSLGRRKQAALDTLNSHLSDHNMPTVSASPGGGSSGGAGGGGGGVGNPSTAVAPFSNGSSSEGGQGEEGGNSSTQRRMSGSRRRTTGSPGATGNPATTGGTPPRELPSGATPQAKAEYQKARREYLEACADEAEQQTMGLFAIAAQTRQNEIMNNMRGANAALARRGVGLGNQSTQAGMQAQSHKAMGGRYQEAAQQQAADAKWKALRNFSKSMAGTSASMGILVGTFHPGDKTVHGMSGIAGLGELGSHYQTGFNNMRMDGAYGNNVRVATGQLLQSTNPGFQFNAASAIGETVNIGNQVTRFGNLGRGQNPVTVTNPDRQRVSPGPQARISSQAPVGGQDRGQGQGGQN